MSEGSWVGLNVYARSVVAGVIDAGSGEVRSLRLPPGNEAAVAWLQTLPAPVRVVYQAGPTGYRLARACADARISCVVAAPSRIRPAADRVKTDRRDAERLARLLRLGEITPVRVPSPEEEAARDLVRAREDARGDLMRARHRLSKLLLRHGLAVRRDRVDKSARRLASPTTIPKRSARDRLRRVLCPDARRQEQTRRARQRHHRARCDATVCRCRRAARLSPRRLYADSVRVDRRARRLAHDFSPSRSARSSVSPQAKTRAGSDAAKARSPRPATATCGGF